MKKYEYEMLHGGEFRGFYLGEEYVGTVSLLVALKYIGQDGWQLVAKVSDNGYIMMREVSE